MIPYLLFVLSLAVSPAQPRASLDPGRSACESALCAFARTDSYPYTRATMTEHVLKRLLELDKLLARRVTSPEADRDILVEVSHLLRSMLWSLTVLGTKADREIAEMLDRNPAFALHLGRAYEDVADRALARLEEPAQTEDEVRLKLYAQTVKTSAAALGHSAVLPVNPPLSPFAPRALLRRLASYLRLAGERHFELSPLIASPFTNEDHARRRAREFAR